MGKYNNRSVGRHAEYKMNKEILFSLKGWEIRKVDRGLYAFEERDSIIYHDCNNVNYTASSFEAGPLIIIDPENLHMKCVFCQEPPPEEVQALWILQNSEYFNG